MHAIGVNALCDKRSPDRGARAERRVAPHQSRVSLAQPIQQLSDPLMAHTFTRQQLYDLVWSKPMSRLGKELGVTDVALKKHCRKAGIPMPERGYWAKLQHGKKVKQTPLPAKPDGAREQIVIRGLEPWQRRPSKPPPPPPVPDEIVQLIERERAAVGEVTVPKTLSHPHLVVARRIEEDRRHRETWRSFGAGDLRHGEDGQLEARRRRILSALFRALEKRGHTIRVDRNRSREAIVTVGREEVPFRLVEIIKQVRRQLTEQERVKHWNPDAKWTQERIKTGKLSFRVDAHLEGWHPGSWADEEGRSVEDRLPEIVVAFAVAGEALRRRRLKREEAAQREWEAQKERWRQQELREREEKRFQALCREAENWRRAGDIRAYVAAVLAAPGADLEALKEWSEWALKKADELDPIASERAVTKSH
jgi:hypothetical protein